MTEKMIGLSKNANWVLEYIESQPAIKVIHQQDINDYLDITPEVIDQCLKTLVHRKLITIKDDIIELW